MSAVGQRLRRMRDAQGLSQRELARRAGVTNATVSMIERDRMSPSVASLKKILDALGTSLGAFFASAEEAPEVVFRKDALLELAGEGGLSLRQVGRDLSGRRLQMLHETYAPGADTGAAMLGHEGEEAGVVVQGRIELTVNGSSFQLGPGDAYAFDSRLPHRFRNPGPEPALIVSACTPPSF
jgi:transcriptional regulator with XRE-family HTH domain